MKDEHGKHNPKHNTNMYNAGLIMGFEKRTNETLIKLLLWGMKENQQKENMLFKLLLTLLYVCLHASYYSN